MLDANEFSDNEGGNELIKKCEKLSKSENLKGKKLSKSGNSKEKKSAKSKNPSKSRNSPRFGVKKAGSSFLTPEARLAFNHLQLAFTKAPIL